jgi:RNA polymerase sigma-70 factor (ECF subfamily)
MHTLAVTGTLPRIATPARPAPHAAEASGTVVGAVDEDRDDVAAAATGDRHAFERLYRRHGQRVFALCLRMTADRALAEELVQDVFVRVWHKLATFRNEAAFGSWLHRVAVNVVLGRPARPRETGDETLLQTAPARTVPVGDRLDLEGAIAGLPAGARRVFVLHDVEGYTHEEIATLLGITSGGSKAQLHRARLLLREALTR